MSSAHPITPVRVYLAVFVALLVGTALTVFAASIDMGAMNTPVALGIAVAKASIVAIYFMGLRYTTPLTKVVAVAGLFWLFIMFGLSMSDYLTRSWMGVPGR